MSSSVSVAPPCQQTFNLITFVSTPLRYGDVAYEQAQYPLAISRRGGRCGPKSGQIAGELENLPLLLGRHRPHGLSLEHSQLGFELL